MNDIIYGLSNEDYHNGEDYRDYISSTSLKHYLKSPRYFKFMQDNPQPQTEAQRFGSLFHLAMQLYQQHGTNEAFWDSVAIFQPPKNPKTDQPYGVTAKAYAEAYTKFLDDNQGKEIATLAEVQQIDDMVGALTRLEIGGVTAKRIRRFLKQATAVEVSYFYVTEDGIKLKIRPDLLTRGRLLIDWKTCALDTLDEDSIARQIIKYRYGISMSMYQYVLHKITGKRYRPILVFVTKSAPYDAIVVDISEWCYGYDKDLDMVTMGVGAVEFKRLLDLHTKCTKENKWPGAESNLPEGDAVMTLKVPVWFDRKTFTE
ncbi:MAG: PD-(D/E)XK nuclease-like domain-containing protein [Muribaculaceae bacterium]|nr:PD-(D/E)XK nuclease-like domain-containing protein [Muribaculaceae bacterium]